MEYYNKISKGYNELHGEEQLRKAEIIASNLVIKDTNKILDIGAGTGLYDSLFNNCKEKTNLDPSEELLKQNKNHKTKNVVGTAEALPFKDKSFDIIISLSALHHTDIRKAIEEIKRVAKPKAQFAFSILKRSQEFENIAKEIRECFEVKREIEEDKDVIFICR